MSSNYLILACDGGGIRGYITASVLLQLVNDATVGNFIPQVSLMAGTSTGSMIAMGLANRNSIEFIQTQYQQANAAPIFTPNPNITGSSAATTAIRATLETLRASGASPDSISWGWLQKLEQYFEYLINAQYTNTGVSQVARTILGSTTTLSSLQPVIVNTLQLDNTSAKPQQWTPVTITNFPKSPYLDMLAYEAALCSGAAPIYFPPFTPTSASLGPCADGGLFANNPSMAALAAALSQNIALENIYMLSVNTGSNADALSTNIINKDWGGPLDMGPLQWLWPATVTDGTVTTPKFPLLSALMDSSADAITLAAQSLLGSRYCRVDVPLTGPVALDDTSDAAYTTMNDSLTAYYGTDAYSQVKTWLQTNFPT